MFANVDKEMATMIADSIGVNSPSGSHVEVTESSPAVSISTTPHSAYIQKVGVLIGNGFDDKEVESVLQELEKNGVFVEVVSVQSGDSGGISVTGETPQERGFREEARRTPHRKRPLGTEISVLSDFLSSIYIYKKDVSEIPSLSPILQG